MSPMNQRGKILHPDRARQINDFSGLLYGKITPTDLDGVIEYHGKAYVFLEIKYDNTELPLGQKIAIERLVKDTSNGGKKSIAIIAEHNVFNTKENIPVAECDVRQVYLYCEKRWREPKTQINVKQCIDGFIKHVDKKNNKFANTS